MEPIFLVLDFYIRSLLNTKCYVHNIYTLGENYVIIIYEQLTILPQNHAYYFSKRNEYLLGYIPGRGVAMGCYGERSLPPNISEHRKFEIQVRKL